MPQRSSILFVLFAIAVPLLFLLDLSTGSTSLSLLQIWNAICGNADAETVKIVCDIRLIKAVVAVLVGVALSVSGLQMQTLFGNPLAGPYVLGVTSGASLGVALFLLATPTMVFPNWFSEIGIAGAAWLGAAAILTLVALIGIRLRNNIVLLILGMMLSSGISAFVQILQYLSSEQALKMFVVWTMGSLGEVTSLQMTMLIPAISAGLILAIITLKPLNLMLLGDKYALSMGVNLKRSRVLILLSTSLLAGTVTAFCGPIGFIGLAVPHVARVAFMEADHRIIMPASALVGICVMLVCDIISRQLLLPINSVTALVGIPIVIWIILKR